jgi:hypothetical protein
MLRIRRLFRVVRTSCPRCTQVDTAASGRCPASSEPRRRRRDTPCQHQHPGGPDLPHFAQTCLTSAEGDLSIGSRSAICAICALRDLRSAKPCASAQILTHPPRPCAVRARQCASSLAAHNPQRPAPAPSATQGARQGQGARNSTRRNLGSPDRLGQVAQTFFLPLAFDVGGMNCTRRRHERCATRSWLVAALHDRGLTRGVKENCRPAKPVLPALLPPTSATSSSFWVAPRPA